MIGGEDRAAENLAAPRLHIGRGDKQLEIVARPQPFEVDGVDKMVAQRIEIERVELIRAQHLGQRVGPLAQPFG